MAEEIKITHTKTKKKSKACLYACLIVLFILLIGLIICYWQAKNWFGDFTASARQATEQSQNSQ
jgi:hypothetical protein